MDDSVAALALEVARKVARIRGCTGLFPSAEATAAEGGGELAGDGDGPALDEPAEASVGETRRQVLVWPTPGAFKTNAVRPPRAIGVEFGNLRLGTDSEILQFARRYGPLGVGCRVRFDRGSEVVAKLAAPGDPYLVDAPWCERLDDWRAEAAYVAGLVKVIEELRSGRAVDIESWKDLVRPPWWLRPAQTFDEPVEAWLPSVEDEVVWWDSEDLGPMPVRRRERLALRGQRRFLAQVLGDHLRTSGVEVGFTWEASGAAIDLVGQPTLRMAVAMSLAEMVATQVQSYRCFNCGRSYVPSRKPATGRRNFCPREDCQRSRKRYSSNSG